MEKAKKKYVGSGKKGKYSIQASIALGRLFTELGLEVLEKGDKKYVVFSDLKDQPSVIKGKDIYVKIEISERQSPDDFGNTHSITLNEWVPDAKKEEPTTQENSTFDDLPF